MSPRNLWAAAERGIAKPTGERGSKNEPHLPRCENERMTPGEREVTKGPLTVCTLHAVSAPVLPRHLQVWDQEHSSDLHSCCLRSGGDISSCSQTSEASYIPAASWWGNLDSFGHVHKQAVSGLRRASLPKRRKPTAGKVLQHISCYR